MDDDTQDETMHGRMDESRLRYWFLLDGDRWLISAGLTVGFFLALLVIGAVDPSTFRAVFRSTNQVGITFQALIASLITGVTLVVTIGQLVLSQEFGSLETQRERMSGAVEFRHDAEEVFGSAGPPDPGTFLRKLIESSMARAENLEDVIATNDDEELHEQVERFVEDLTENAEEVIDQLGDVQFGEFELFRAAMNYNYSWKIFGIQWLRSEYEGSLSASDDELFEELLDALTLFGVTRGHFKSIYYQWELVRLLRSILVTAIPALVVATATLLFLEPNSFQGTFLAVPTIIWVVGGASALSATPFFVLTSIVLRVTTIAKRTGAIGPFVLHESDRGDDIDLYDSAAQ